MRISDWSSDVCSSDLAVGVEHRHQRLVETAFLDRAVGALLADQRERVDGFAVDAFDGGDGVAAHALVRLWMERIERGVAGTHAERLDPGVRFLRGELRGIDRKSTRLNSSH